MKTELCFIDPRNGGFFPDIGPVCSLSLPDWDVYLHQRNWSWFLVFFRNRPKCHSQLINPHHLPIISLNLPKNIPICQLPHAAEIRCPTMSMGWMQPEISTWWYQKCGFPGWIMGNNDDYMDYNPCHPNRPILTTLKNHGLVLDLFILEWSQLSNFPTRRIWDILNTTFGILSLWLSDIYI